MAHNPVAETPPGSGHSEQREQSRGFLVFVMLAILTILEFVVAIAVDDSFWLVIGLTPFALVKAALIFYVFMHVYKLWRGEEEHE